MYKVLVHKAILWKREKQKNLNFLKFSTLNYDFFSKYQFCVKNVFFLGTFCCCSSKSERVWHLAKMALLAPLSFAHFLSYSNIMYLKRTHFSQRIDIQKTKSQFAVKKLKKFKFSIFPFFTYNLDSEEKSFCFLLKYLKKVNFFISSMSHRRIMY